jgi:type IV pilus assembly protein PilV
MSAINFRCRQSGIFLIEALIGILIFSLGIITLIALQATSIAVQADAQYRIEAANLADQMMGNIVLNVDRTTPATVATSLAAFAHMTGGAACAYAGTPSGNALVTAWATSINTTATTRLPGSTAAMQQILINQAAGAYNQVTINICWQSPSDRAPRRHTLVSYVN